MNDINILQLLSDASQRGASDLHFTVGQPLPVVSKVFSNPFLIPP